MARCSGPHVFCLIASHQPLSDRLEFVLSGAFCMRIFQARLQTNRVFWAVLTIVMFCSMWFLPAGISRSPYHALGCVRALHRQVWPICLRAAQFPCFHDASVWCLRRRPWRGAPGNACRAVYCLASQFGIDNKTRRLALPGAAGRGFGRICCLCLKAPWMSAGLLSGSNARP